MLSLASRLKAIEKKLRARTPDSEIRLYWHDELVPYSKHDDCYFEPATEEHHCDVTVLSWDHRE